jgi:hypothetical protein
MKNKYLDYYAEKLANFIIVFTLLAFFAYLTISYQKTITKEAIKETQIKQ